MIKSLVSSATFRNVSCLGIDLLSVTKSAFVVVKPFDLPFIRKELVVAMLGRTREAMDRHRPSI